jgi:hypothetical protein
VAWTYTNDPLNSQRDAARFLTGDTDSNAPLLSDEEMDFLLETHGGSPLPAAAAACDAIAAKLAKNVDHSTGRLSVSASQRVENYIARAKLLSKRVAMRSVRLVAMGSLPHAMHRYNNPCMVEPMLEVDPLTQAGYATPAVYTVWERWIKR